MSSIDYVILVILLLSSLLSLMRGFVREALSLIAWILALWVAVKFAPSMANLLIEQITISPLRHGIAFIILFLATLLSLGVINFFISFLIKSSGLSSTDKTLGLVFGLARGVIVVTVLVFLGGITPLSNSAWWRESMFIGMFQHMASWLWTFMPPGLGLVKE